MKTVLISCIYFLLICPLKAQTLKDEWVTCNIKGCKLLDPYYKKGVTFTWDGSCILGKAAGFGTATKYMKGGLESTFRGEYRDGIREGKGKFTLKNGEIFEGYFKKGQLVGYGSWSDEEGHYYEGDFVNYRRHGFGVLKYTDGSKFDGYFVSDRPYTGKYITREKKISYLQKYYPVEKIDFSTTSNRPQLGVKTTEYFDENWVRCQQTNAAFYRVVTYEAENRPKGVVKDYYITGQLQSDFFAPYLDYDDEGKNFHEGEANWYFKNGKIEQKRFYLNNKIDGKNSFFYENGAKLSEAMYSNGQLNGEYVSWYKTGKIHLYAIYENGVLYDNKYVEYDENGQGALVFDENFRMNKDKWKLDVANSQSYILENDHVYLNLSKSNMISRFNYITLNQNSDYSIESIIQKRSGSGTEGYGILFGLKDWDNYYQFLISEYGSYTIIGNYEGISLKIKDWTRSDAINTGFKRNLLKVMKFDDEFIFSINGQIVVKTKSYDLRGNNFGISASGKGEYVLENILIKEFVSVEELEKKAPKTTASNPDEWKGNGSGFFVSERGYIATNYHVVKDATAIQVEYFQRGVKYTFPAKVIGTDKENDLAIIQIQDTRFRTLPVIPYLFSSYLKDVGSDVFALGYPIANVMGDEIKFTDGKISAKTGIQGDVRVYQISVPIQPGNSGGPLFDSKGNLVGITSSALNKEYFNSENVNYAIKTSYLRSLIETMQEQIVLPNYYEIYNKPLTEKIKILSDFIPIIRVK